MSTPRPNVCELLGIRVPILLAGMAGGPTTSALVAAVSNAGGLGVLGASGMSVDALVTAVREAKALTSAPIGVNVLLAPPRPVERDLGELMRVLGDAREALGLSPKPPVAKPPATPIELVEAALAAGVDVVSVGLGDPAPLRGIATAHGAPLVAMVATVADARASEASGADVLVAQGGEAGGHRSNFTLPEGDEPLPMVGTMALVPQVVDAVSVPVVAAGGIADGRGLVAALALGAQGIQLGTRFLLASESGAFAAYRERVRTARDQDTVITTALSGRPARGLPNHLIRELERAGNPSLGWPRQAAGLAEIRRAAEAANDPERTSLWTGQGAAIATREQSAADIVAEIMDEARSLVRSLGAGPLVSPPAGRPRR